MRKFPFLEVTPIGAVRNHPCFDNPASIAYGEGEQEKPPLYRSVSCKHPIAPTARIALKSANFDGPTVFS